MPFGIEWDKVESKYNWLAVDRCGAIYAYSFKPVKTTDTYWGYNGNNFERIGLLVREWDDPTWTTMIAERPQTKGEEFIPEVGKGHKHHKEMLQYAQDAAAHKEPWKLWEWRDKNTAWTNIVRHPSWCEFNEYRRKPQTVTVTIPEDVATEFTNLVLMRDCCKVISVAIQEALNNRYD